MLDAGTIVCNIAVSWPDKKLERNIDVTWNGPHSPTLFNKCMEVYVLNMDMPTNLCCPATPRVLGPQRAGTVGAQKSANRVGQGSSFAHKQCTVDRGHAG